MANLPNEPPEMLQQLWQLFGTQPGQGRSLYQAPASKDQTRLPSAPYASALPSSRVNAGFEDMSAAPMQQFQLQQFLQGLLNPGMSGGMAPDLGMLLDPTLGGGDGPR